MTDEFEGCLREIDWKRGRPYIWRKVDYENLSRSKKIFARKFDANVDKDIINLLIEKIKMNQTPKVSMLIPIYGGEKFIERCAVSLFEQTYQNIEYIFVNDCTKDNSVVILKNVVERYPQRKPQVRIIEHEKNKGLAGARNTAVAAATGEFVMHVDSDDYVDKDIVKRAILSQKKVDADIVIVDFKKAYPTFDVEVRHPVFSKTSLYCISVLERNIPNTIWGKLIRRRLYVDNSVCCLEGNNQGEDYQVLPKLYYYAKI